MRTTLFALLALTLVLVAPMAAAYDTNVDLKKQGGDDAWDVAIVLAGDEHVTNTYDGYSSCHFDTKTIDSAGSNTVIHWETPTGSVGGDGIQDGEVIHVGFSTADHDADIVDSYWTDEDGARIFGSKILIVGGHIGRDRVRVTNNFPLVAEVSVRAATFDGALPLEVLNARNDELMAQLEPLGGPFILLPGDEMVLPFEMPAPDGGAVVVLIESQGDGSQAVAMNFQQQDFGTATVDADLP